MAYVLIIHQVADYAAWKVVFDDAWVLRKAAGEISYQVLSYEKDKNKIVHFSRWRSLEEAKAFFESDEVVKIREQAGVTAPDFIYLNELEAGVL